MFLRPLYHNLVAAGKTHLQSIAIFFYSPKNNWTLYPVPASKHNSGVTQRSTSCPTYYIDVKPQAMFAAHAYRQYEQQQGGLLHEAWDTA